MHTGAPGRKLSIGPCAEENRRFFAQLRRMRSGSGWQPPSLRCRRECARYSGSLSAVLGCPRRAGGSPRRVIAAPVPASGTHCASGSPPSTWSRPRPRASGYGQAGPGGYPPRQAAVGGCDLLSPTAWRPQLLGDLGQCAPTLHSHGPALPRPKMQGLCTCGANIRRYMAKNWLMRRGSRKSRVAPRDRSPVGGLR
jgi:hypothetical protein